MIRTNFAMVLWCLSVTAFEQTPPAQAPLVKNQKVEVKGTIERVQVIPGQGMPYLELKGETATYRVMLGSIRYLMEQNFNPKAGSVAIVKGFLVGELIVAQNVAIPAEKVTIQLRDENGLPLWRKGHWGMKEKK